MNGWMGAVVKLSLDLTYLLLLMVFASPGLGRADAVRPPFAEPLVNPHRLLKPTSQTWTHVACVCVLAAADVKRHSCAALLSGWCAA